MGGTKAQAALLPWVCWNRRVGGHWPPWDTPCTWLPWFSLPQPPPPPASLKILKTPGPCIQTFPGGTWDHSKIPLPRIVGWNGKSRPPPTGAPCTTQRVSGGPAEGLSMLHWATGMPIKIPWPPGPQSTIWALGLPCPAAGLGWLRNSSALLLASEVTAASTGWGRWGGDGPRGLSREGKGWATGRGRDEAISQDKEIRGQEKGRGGEGGSSGNG